MFLINNRNINDPRINLALEEYCLRHLDLENEYLLLYVNEPSVIIGRHQNVLAEINYRFVAEKGIRVVRRMSGGGTVYHDFGNLNYSFIRRYEHNTLVNIKTIIQPVVTALNRLGIPAGVNDRNDIVVRGKKISGNAQFSNTKGIIIHGTLLFDSDLDTEEKVLGIKQTSIESKAPESTRSEIVNISRCLENHMSMVGFTNHLINTLVEINGGLQAFTLANKDWQNIFKLAEDKYGSWDWNYGKSPDFTVSETVTVNGDKIDARLDVKKGAIENIRFNGSIKVPIDTMDLVGRLEGQKYDPEALSRAMS